MKTAFVTDSGTGESMEVLSREGIYSVPLQISCGEQSYSDSVDITIDEVYERMREGAMLSTSLPSVGKIVELFEQLKAEGYERIFAVPICSGLSGTVGEIQKAAPGARVKSGLALRGSDVDGAKNALAQWIKAGQ